MSPVRKHRYTPKEVYPTPLISNSAGTSMSVTKYMTTAMMALDMISMRFSAGPTWASVLTRTSRIVIRLTGMPIAEMTIGYRSASTLPAKAIALMTMAAQVLSAQEPKRSAPIPATSPTLSPTLSAITAGLRGSSSGIPASTLPTRSAPTSAAFVKIPPPTRANSAMEDPPRPKPAMTSINTCDGRSSGITYLRAR